METTMYSTMNVVTSVSNGMVSEPVTEPVVVGGNDRQFLDFDISKVQTMAEFLNTHIL